MKENIKNQEGNFKAEKSEKVALSSNSKIAKYFGFSNSNATFKKEIIGGISTFLSMMYILAVEPAILGSAQSITNSKVTMDAGGVFLATAITSFLATFIMGISANVPIGLAPSMGLNAMFSFNIANQGGIGYEGALIATMLSSILFCIISVTKLRTLMIKSLPHSLHLSIGVAIGFFIAYVGLANIGWVQPEMIPDGEGGYIPSGLPVANLNNFKANYPGIILGTVCLFVAIVLHFKKFFAPVALVMVFGFGIAVLLANVSDNTAIQNSFGAAKWNSSNWDYSQFSGLWTNLKSTGEQFINPEIWNKPTMYVAIFIFIILNFFDATGTITTINIELNRERGYEKDIPHSALIIDAGATIAGSALGVSHMACYAESCVGISQGARTGFSAIITSMGFLLAIPLFPIFQMMPPAISGAATVFIGTVMMKSITGIEWEKPEIGLAAFFCMLFMIITYNIANGIAMGVIAYSVGALATGKRKEVHPIIWILDVFFILYFIAYAFIQ